jgi:hypothetical protein
MNQTPGHHCFLSIIFLSEKMKSPLFNRLSVYWFAIVCPWLFIGCPQKPDPQFPVLKNRDSLPAINKTDSLTRNLHDKNMEEYKKRCDPDWVSRFDFNGDAIRDSVVWTFSGGAHCCYSISVLLRGIEKRFDFPFHMDGGYLCGLNLSRPHQFNIRDFDGDGLPEIYMLIETYNYDLYDIPAAWRKKYGITQNEILLKFVNNRPVLRDFYPDEGITKSGNPNYRRVK